jgi:hypothetical protein
MDAEGWPTHEHRLGKIFLPPDRLCPPPVKADALGD